MPHTGAGNRCNAETGYWIGKPYWRRGIASDALAQVVDWGFAALPQLTRVYAPIFARNEGSQAVARKCGFVREGVLRDYTFERGRFVDNVVYARFPL